MERLTTNIVPFDGPTDSKALFLGEAPGEEEDYAIKPFQGEAGRLLGRCFRTVGINRAEVEIGNIFMQRPPRNDIGYYFQDKKHSVLTWEGQEHVEHLKQRLSEKKREGNLNLIIAMGAIPLSILTGKKRITKWRGSVLPCTLVEGLKVYATNHPSYVNRLMNEPEERLFGEKKKQQQNALPIFLRDLERVQAQWEFPEIRRPQRTFKVLTTLPMVLDELRKLKDASAVAVDIETLNSSEGLLLWCIGFAPRPDYAFTVPFIKSRKVVWTPREEAIILKWFSRFFLSPIPKVFHNGLFDLSVLGRYYGLRCKKESVEDTMWCFHASFPYLKKALEVLTSIYTWEPYYKDDGKVWDGRRISDQAEYIYNCRDCAVTREIWPQVERDAKELKTWNGYKRTMGVTPSLINMQVKGIRINVKEKAELQQKFSLKVKEAEDIITRETKKVWNLNSSPQMIRLVYGFLGLPMQYQHKTKKPTTNKDALNRLRKKRPHDPVLKAIVDHRGFAKLQQTYASMEIENDNRIRTSYNIISTFRLSSSESLFGAGGNLQNIPVRTEEGRLIRKLFIPDEGMNFLKSDLSQAEARVVAWLSGDFRLIEAFSAGEDVHWLNAIMIFKMLEDLKYNPLDLYKDEFTNEEHSHYFYRQLAKKIVYAASYGMGPFMLQSILIQEEIYLPIALCKQLLYHYKLNNPLLTTWQNSVKEEIRATRTLYSPEPFSRKRVFRGRLNDALFRSAIAFKPQSVVGEILEVAIGEIDEKSKVYQPLSNVHDEVLGQCKPRDNLQAMKEIKKEMEIPLYIGGRELIIPCDFKVGPNWRDCKDISIEGLEEKGNETCKAETSKLA